MTTFKQIVDEMNRNVSYATPYEPKTNRNSSGSMVFRGISNAGIPTRAFIILVKLMTFRPTVRQIQSLLDYSASPFPRVLGFLFVRYCSHPEELWDWLSPYFDDDEEVQLHRDDSRKITIGQMVRDFLEKMEYFDTYFYRIPVALHRKILVDMKDLGYRVHVVKDVAGHVKKYHRGDDDDESAKLSSGPEKRVDPLDGQKYTREEFFKAYGGYDEWRRAAKSSSSTAASMKKSTKAMRRIKKGTELRIDPSDGNAYTKLEFVTCYGGLDEWDAATPIEETTTKKYDSQEEDEEDGMRDNEIGVHDLPPPPSLPPPPPSLPPPGQSSSRHSRMPESDDNGDKRRRRDRDRRESYRHDRRSDRHYRRSRSRSRERSRRSSGGGRRRY